MPENLREKLREELREEPQESAPPNPAAPPSIRMELRELVVGYHGRAILPPISLAIRAGEMWAVVGRNGSGKSTLLRTLLGLQPALTGIRTVAPQTRIGYVSQRLGVDRSIPSRVLDVILDGSERGYSFLRPFRPRRIRAVVEHVLEETRTSHLARRQLAELSDGELQRVLLARALAAEPHVLVLDEPTSAMDMVAERTVFELLIHFQRCHRLAVIFVCHHLPLVSTYADQVLFVDKEEGLVQLGSSRDFLRSAAFARHYGLEVPLAVEERSCVAPESLEAGRSYG